MAKIVLADGGIEFDGDSPGKGPLGGVESSIVNLTRELAARGHEVVVRNKCLAAKVIDGVDWAPLSDGMPEKADLYIANRGDKLLTLMPNARRMVFWIHNPAGYLLKWRYLSKLWRYKPAIIFIGHYHATTYPGWAPGAERIVIPYGIADQFRSAQPSDQPPPPRAIFTSNPLRSLDWLLDLWAEKIHPQIPAAELHLFGGPATYGAVGESKRVEMEKVLEKARNMADKGICLRDPVAKSHLMEEFRKSRVMLYKGDINETFCLAVGEAQAAGVPAVVQRLGSVVERVIDGKTGHIAESDDDFASMAVSLLNNDEIWLRQHESALASQGKWGWPEAAEAFERLLNR